MEIFKDINRFLSLLTGVDVIFFVAIITLLILIVTLIYFIKINKDDNMFNEDDFFNVGNNDKKDDIVNNIIEKIEKENKEEKEKEVVEVSSEYLDEEEGELVDLKSLTAKLESMANNSLEDKVTEYEKEQESKAIISYSELLEKHNRYKINYDEIKTADDLIIKKVNLEECQGNEIEERQEVRVISYSHEEAFLNALKELNGLLN